MYRYILLTVPVPVTGPPEARLLREHGLRRKTDGDAIKTRHMIDHDEPAAVPPALQLPAGSLPPPLHEEPRVTLESLPCEMVWHMCLEYVPPKSVLALSFTCHAIARVLRECCSCESGTHQFWIEMTTKHLGRCAFDYGLVRAEKLGPWPAFGVKLFETGLNMRREVKDRIEIVLGSVAEQVGGCTVVACPCLVNLDHYGTGAQGAVRRAAGDETEEAASKLPLPLAPLSANLVTGGKLADTVAFCVTSPPREVHQIILNGMFFQGFGQMPAVASADGLSPRSRVDQLERQVSDTLHLNLFRRMREAGHSSVAMPTLGTGGMGFELHNMLPGLSNAYLVDFQSNPHQPLRVRIACYEQSHFNAALEMKEVLLERLLNEPARPDSLPTIPGQQPPSLLAPATPEDPPTTLVPEAPAPEPDALAPGAPAPAAPAHDGPGSDVPVLAAGY